MSDRTEVRVVLLQKKYLETRGLFKSRLDLSTKGTLVSVEITHITKRAQRVLFLARETAEQSGNKYLWLEHLLYAVMRVSDSAQGALERAGITAEVVYKYLPGAHFAKVRHVSMQPRVRSLISSIVWAMDQTGNIEIHPGHFVLAMIHDQVKLIVDIAQEVKISLPDLHNLIIDAMNYDTDYALRELLRKDDKEDM